MMPPYLRRPPPRRSTSSIASPAEKRPGEGDRRVAERGELLDQCRAACEARCRAARRPALDGALSMTRSVNAHRAAFSVSSATSSSPSAAHDERAARAPWRARSSRSAFCFGGRVDERPRRANGLEGRLHLGGVVGHEHERQSGRLADPRGDCREARGVAASRSRRRSRSAVAAGLARSRRRAPRRRPRRSRRRIAESTTETPIAQGFTNVLSWRKSTVSSPTVNAASPVPTVTARIGGAEASESAAFASSETCGQADELSLALGELHREREARRHAAVTAVGLRQVLEDLDVRSVPSVTPIGRRASRTSGPWSGPDGPRS